MKSAYFFFKQRELRTSVSFQKLSRWKKIYKRTEHAHAKDIAWDRPEGPGGVLFICTAQDPSSAW